MDRFGMKYFDRFYDRATQANRIVLDADMKMRTKDRDRYKSGSRRFEDCLYSTSFNYSYGNFFFFSIFWKRRNFVTRVRPESIGVNPAGPYS